MLGEPEQLAQAKAPRGASSSLLLACCQGLYICAISVDMTLTGLVGLELSKQKFLATLPFALITVSTALGTFIVPFLLRFSGKRAGFLLGGIFCAVGGGVSVWSILHNEFGLFCLGTSCVGVFQAFAQYYRLAAADAVEGPDKSKAISTVLAGGICAAVLGPALANWTTNALAPDLFAGSYLVVVFCGLLTVILVGLCYTETSTGAVKPLDPIAARPLMTIATQPIFIAAVANSTIGYVVMMYIMTAAPLAALGCGYSIGDGTKIIQWHLIGMYAPSFFSGRAIAKLGVAKVVLIGSMLVAAGAVTAAASTVLYAFYAGLFSLGVGWNFMFVGGTTLLAGSYSPTERAKTQGLAEALRFTATAIATLLAGAVLGRYGWGVINIAALPILSLSVLVTLWWSRTKNHF